MLDLIDNQDDALVRFIELVAYKIGLNAVKRLFVTKNSNPILYNLTIERNTFTASAKLVESFFKLAEDKLDTMYAFHRLKIAFIDLAEESETKSIVIIVVATDVI